MRLIRKHVLRTFLVPWVYCLLAFMVVYVIYDLFDHLEDFVDAKAPLRRVLLYYAWLMPSVAWIILPVSLLLATLYALYQLTKNNEITAMKASGISLPRVVAPIVGLGVLASLAVAAVEQSLAPSAAQWTQTYLRSLDKRGKVSANVRQDLAFYVPLARHHWRIRLMDIRTTEMEGVTIEVLRPSGPKEREIRAESATWTNRAWRLEDVEVRHFNEEGFPAPRHDVDGTRLPTIEQLDEVVLDTAEFPEVPEDFLNTIKDSEHLSSWEMIRYLRDHPGVTSKTRAKYLTNSHVKLATPWACLVVIILGIPFGNTTARKGAMFGVILCLSLFFGYYVLIILFKIFGHREFLHPALAAWTPNLVMGAIGLIQLRRMT